MRIDAPITSIIPDSGGATPQIMIFVLTPACVVPKLRISYVILSKDVDIIEKNHESVN